MKKPLNYHGLAFSDELSKKDRKKYQKQLKQTGIDNTEVWALDTTIAKFILPRLQLLRKTAHGYPNSLSSEEEWKAILLQMEDTFQLVIDSHLTIPNLNKLNQGMQLFATYYRDLWD